MSAHTIPATRQRRLMTIGYEGRTVDGLLGELAESGIDVLVDVRELPLSRRRGFSKNALRERLRAAGIEYVHLRPLGSPRDARHKLHRDGDYRAFFAAYSKHIEQQADAVRSVLELLDGRSVCLMCYEAEVQKCHRRVLADVLEGGSAQKLEVVHR